MDKLLIGRRAALSLTAALAVPAVVRAQAKTVSLGVGSAIIEYVPAPLTPKLGYYAPKG